VRLIENGAVCKAHDFQLELLHFALTPLKTSKFSRLKHRIIRMAYFPLIVIELFEIKKIIN